jgi:Holliday junction resolvasome RuvABC ATP-dependent DNA helicase subunit
MGSTLCTVKMPIREKELNMELLRTRADVVLFDEVHAASSKLQEALLPLLEEGVLSLTSGRRVNFEITIIGATTEPQKLIDPLVTRFVSKPSFDEYTDEEMGLIVAGLAERVQVRLDKAQCEQIGIAAAGVPRNARSLVVTARDMTIANGHQPTIEELFALRRIDSNGLSTDHHRYLEMLGRMDGRAGLSTMMGILNMPQLLVTQIERLLLKKGLLSMQSTGRHLTPEGWRMVDGR